MKLTIDQLRQLRFGGTADAAAMGLLMSSGILSAPGLMGTMPSGVAAGLAALGGAHIGKRLLDVLHSVSVFRKSNIPVMEHPVAPGDGLLLGYHTETGKPIYLNDTFFRRHGFIGGQSGVGKTQFALLMMVQQIARGGGLLFIDGKLDLQNVRDMYAICAWAGRLDDFYVINPDDPNLSNTYNPILWYRPQDLVYGKDVNPNILKDPDEVASQALALIPSTENDPGADHFKQSANQGVSTLIGALQAADLAYNFSDLAILLMNGKAIENLESILDDRKRNGQMSEKDLDAMTDLELFLNQFRRAAKAGDPPMLSVDKMKDTFGGIGGRMHLFGSNRFGEVTKSYNPDLNLFNAIVGNKIVMVCLPTMGKDLAATNFGKMMISDLRVAIARIQKLTEDQKPNPVFMGFFDEAGSYVNQSWSRMFEQSRSANVSLWPAVQVLANFDIISPELSEMVVGNCWNKIFFKLGTQDSAERAADLLGQMSKSTKSFSESDNASQSSSVTTPNAQINAGEGEGMGYSEREDEDYRVSADDLKGLGIGEAVFSFGYNYIHEMKIPQVTISPKLRKQAGDYRARRIKPPGEKFKRKGIDLFSKAGQLTQKGRSNKEKPKDDDDDSSTAQHRAENPDLAREIGMDQNTVAKYQESARRKIEERAQLAAAIKHESVRNRE